MSTTQAPATVRIMVADDHELIAAGIAAALRPPAYEIVAVAGTREAIVETAIATRPDVLLLDLEMPGTSGIQILGELRPRLPETRIIILTASESERDMLDALARGADGYLTKSAGPTALHRGVAAAMRGEIVLSRMRATTALRHFIEQARSGRTAGAPAGLPITPREMDVLRMLADGLTGREIAQAMTISLRTVETHVANLTRKLEVRSRSEAVRLYRASR